MIHLKIAITDTFNPKLDYYFSWLNRFEPNLQWVVLSHKSNNLHELDTADGLLISGGGDLDPALLGVTDSAGHSKDVDRSRDDFELQAVHMALAKGIPLLGICRGLQVVNFALGGTLILDLPSAGFKDHANTNDYQLAHTVTVEPNTLLAALTGRSLLQINTSHHQAIDKPGNGLMVSAYSPDGVIEAAEWENKEGKPFCCLVQWHPERMADAPDNTASRALAEGFLRATRVSVAGVVAMGAIFGSLVLTNGCVCCCGKDTDKVISMNDLPPAVKVLAEKEVAGCKTQIAG